MAAANARLDGVRQMFTFLMVEEERHHEAILEHVMTSYSIHYTKLYESGLGIPYIYQKKFPIGTIVARMAPFMQL